MVGAVVAVGEKKCSESVADAKGQNCSKSAEAVRE